MKYSIITVNFNNKDGLRKTIESVIHQTFRDFEFIIIDGGSTDGSVDILKEYAAKDNRIKIIEFKKNKGQGYARNYALYKYTQGKYIMFLDNDDWYEPNAFELVYNQIVKNNNDFVVFGYNKVNNETGEVVPQERCLKPYIDVINEPDIKLYDLKKSFIYTPFIWKCIYCKNFLIKNSIKCSEDLRRCEDVEFYVRSVSASNSVSVLSKYIYNYRIRNDSMSKSNHLYREHFIGRKRGYRIFKKSKHDYMFSYIPYIIRSNMHMYKTLKSSNAVVRRDFYIQMRKDFIKLSKKYNIEDFKDQILYEKFLSICERSWNEKSNVYFEIPNFIVVKLNRKGYLMTKLFNRFVFTRNKFNKFKSRMFSIRDTKNKKHKLIKFLGFKIKIRKRKK